MQINDRDQRTQSELLPIAKLGWRIWSVMLLAPDVEEKCSVPFRKQSLSPMSETRLFRVFNQTYPHRHQTILYMKLLFVNTPPLPPFYARVL